MERKLYFGAVVTIADQKNDRAHSTSLPTPPISIPTIMIVVPSSGKDTPLSELEMMLALACSILMAGVRHPVGGVAHIIVSGKCASPA